MNPITPVRLSRKRTILLSRCKVVRSQRGHPFSTYPPLLAFCLFTAKPTGVTRHFSTSVRDLHHSSSHSAWRANGSSRGPGALALHQDQAQEVKL